jgi:hypothetical protein
MGVISSGHMGLTSCAENASRLIPLASPIGDVVDSPSKFKSVTLQVKDIL